MESGWLAIAAAAAALGLALGYYMSGDGSDVTTTVVGRTVTVRETVTETVARPTAQPDRRSGRRVFVTACSRCHTFAPGDWRRGRVNLADLQPSYRTTVEKVRGGGIAMPSFGGKLSAREIRDVAAFVTAEAARRAGRSR
jgi:mono/diheme cytochrome c family protein